MKTLLLFSISSVLSFGAVAQCNELFISEYVEGWSNNKALEIYNPTFSAVDLSNYQLERFSNGSQTSGADKTIALSGTLAPNDVLVIVLDKRDANGTGQDAPVWDSLQAKADIFLNPDYNTNNVMYFNGNDAIVLSTISPYAPVDIIGKIGENPDGGWNNVGPTYMSIDNNATPWTKDQTMVRKANILEGETDALISAFDPSLEWDTIGANQFDGLGSHICDCQQFPASISENTSNIVNVYPNPASTVLNIFSTENIQAISIVDLVGREVLVSTVNNTTNEVLNIETLVRGTYLMNVYSTNGSVATQKIIKK